MTISTDLFRSKSLYAIAVALLILAPLIFATGVARQRLDHLEQDAASIRALVEEQARANARIEAAVAAINTDTRHINRRLDNIEAQLARVYGGRFGTQTPALGQVSPP